MQIKKKLSLLYNGWNKKFEEQFEFKIQDVSFKKMVIYMNKPKDPSSLAVARILFGLAMLFDIPDERGGVNMEKIWGNTKLCHFPLLPYVLPLQMPYMALVYAALWLGALGIMLGYKYKVASATFVVAYWYLLLIEKSYWNNHSYLFGLVGLLFACTDANCYWSLDAHLDPSKRKENVPYWNYFILKYQFFILYFMAGLKKGTAEWLSGYSVQKLSEHWVFAPFRLFLTVPQTDYLVVHWFIFAFDLTVAAWMMWARSRHVAMVFCALFHLMNSRLFRIGMFPWVCLATMPLFYPFDWPKLAIKLAKDLYCSCLQKIIRFFTKVWHSKDCQCWEVKYDKENVTENEIDEDKDEDESNINTNDGKNAKDDIKILKDSGFDGNNKASAAKTNIEKEDKNVKGLSQKETAGNEDPEKNYLTMYLILFFVITQAFLPFSHFITKGYNNWTDGLYGYSWDMMVHTWEPHAVVVKVVDNDYKREFYVDPYLFTPNGRWTRHGDMVHQYARCLEQKMVKSRTNVGDRRESRNISVYIDVWCSMNGRFVQRMFDPKVDVLKVEWSPLQPVSFLMPVLDQALHWRTTLDEIREIVNSWSNHSDVTFFADFPGYDHESFIPTELRNVTLTVLKGLVAFVPEVSDMSRGHCYKMADGNWTAVRSGRLHHVLNIGNTTAFYMYTYYNSSETFEQVNQKPKLPIGTELLGRFKNMVKFGAIVFKGVISSMFKCPRCH